MAKLLGIDVGTSGCKVLLIDDGGSVLAQAASEYPFSVPRPLWSEQNPGDWWDGVQNCLSAIGNEQVDAIGVTGQMHGAVFLDANDEVIRPAILWNDQRTAEECKEIDRTVGAERVRAITCNPPLTGFQAPKLLWLRNNERANYDRVRWLLLPKDYIRMKLTGQKVSEVSDASGTGIFDVPKRAWSGEMIAALGLNAVNLPDVVESTVITGKTARGVPVVGGGGDQAAGAVGTGAVVTGVISVSLGTSGVVFTAIDAPNFDPGGAAHTFCHATGKWHAMGVMLSCGGALRWYRDTVCPGMTYDEISAGAEAAPPGCEDLTFLPYLTGERCPHNDSEARAAFAGLTLGHTREHLSRAVFEGVSFGLLDCMNLLRTLGASAEEIRVTGGGARNSFWMQILADLFGKTCVSLECDEGPAYGAAILAGVGIGVWPDVADACSKIVRVRNRVAPTGVDYARPYARYQGLYSQTRGWNAL